MLSPDFHLQLVVAIRNHRVFRILPTYPDPVRLEQRGYPRWPATFSRKSGICTDLPRGVTTSVTTASTDEKLPRVTNRWKAMPLVKLDERFSEPWIKRESFLIMVGVFKFEIWTETLKLQFKLQTNFEFKNSTEVTSSIERDSHICLYISNTASYVTTYKQQEGVCWKLLVSQMICCENAK